MHINKKLELAKGRGWIKSGLLESSLSADLLLGTHRTRFCVSDPKQLKHAQGKTRMRLGRKDQAFDSYSALFKNFKKE